MTTVRAKFTCYNKFIDSMENTQIVMFPVWSSDPDGENKKFCDATPAGQFSMSITKGKAAADFFEPGKEYYLDITKV